MHLRAIDDLIRLGATEVVVEEFEASLEMFARALESYEIPASRIAHELDAIRHEHYGLLRGTAMPDLTLDTLKHLGIHEALELVEVEARSRASGENARTLDLRRETGAIQVAVSRDGVPIYRRDQSFRYEDGDTAVLVGDREALDRAGELFRGRVGARARRAPAGAEWGEGASVSAGGGVRGCRPRLGLVPAFFPLFERLRPIALEQTRHRPVGEELAAGLTRRAVVRLVARVDDSLHRRPASGAGLVVSPMHRHLRAKRGDFLREPVAGLASESLGPLAEGRLGGGVKSRDLRLGEAAGELDRREPGGVQDLVGVGISDPGEEPRVGERSLQRMVLGRQHPGKRADVGAERLETAAVVLGEGGLSGHDVQRRPLS